MTLPDACPRCGSAMERGHITGQMRYLNWTPKGTRPGVVTLGKEHLAVGSLTRPPMLPAARCGSCGLGLFAT